MKIKIEKNFPLRARRFLLIFILAAGNMYCVANEKEGRNWYPDPIAGIGYPDIEGIDINHRPAGKHGFVGTSGEDFVFGDGSKARFWGVNIQAYALLGTSREAACLHAKRLARLGINLVRFHHFDSDWVTPNIFIPEDNDTKRINQQSLDKLDWWVNCLKEEGIYIWLDLHVGRNFKVGDNITDFKDVAKGKSKSELKGFNYFNDDILLAMADFNRQLLHHKNPYTNTRYAEEPAVMGALITNENDLTHHYGNALLADKGVPKHHAKFIKALNEISLSERLDKRASLRTWEMGDSKILLNHVEQRFFERITKSIRHTGFKAPIATTNYWGGMSLAGLPSLASGDFIDSHFYSTQEELTKSPIQSAGIIHWLSSAQVYGKPYSVSEWNVQNFPDPVRNQLPLMIAGQSALQGWDALMLYGYSQVPLHKLTTGDNWSSFMDPSIMALMPAASLLYRQHHVSLANHSYRFRIPEDIFFSNSITANTSIALRTLSEQSKVTIDTSYEAAPWLARTIDSSQDEELGETLIASDYKFSYLGNNQHQVVSDTGEITRDWEKGLYTIVTPKSIVISGNVKNAANFVYGPLEVMIESDNLTIAVQSLDQNKISESNRIFVTVIGDSTPPAVDGEPYRIRSFSGKLALSLDGKFKMTKLPGGDGFKNVVASDDGKYQIEFNAETRSPWTLLERVD